MFHVFWGRKILEKDLFQNLVGICKLFDILYSEKSATQTVPDNFYENKR